MTPLIFGADPWWIVLIKVVGMFVLLLAFTIFNVWFERRVVGKMQHRRGPVMNGPFGLGQALGDGMKCLVKEDFRPHGADKVIFSLAPFISGLAAFTAWSVIPLGGEVEMFGVTTSLQLTDLPMGVLFVLSVASVGIYGIVLAGWSSTSPYSILGGIRSTAQMVSYEVAMGLSLVSVFLWSSSMSTSDIVAAQQLPLRVLPQLEIPGWYGLLLLPSFVIYFISIVAETNRAPFDLVECEQELISGYCTDYSGFRYAIYFLAEYINMATVSAMATTLFLGGWHVPWPLSLIEVGGHRLDDGWLGPIWFFAKVLVCIFVFVWLRGTLPRFRYDQFMDLGWRWLIPISLGWIVLIAFVSVAIEGSWLTAQSTLILAGVLIVILLASVFLSRKPEAPEVRSEVSRVPPPSDEPFDPFAGGYPVPPLPGQVLPELADVMAGDPVGDLAEPAAAAGVAETGKGV
ncbi:MAG: NADH-quinone oxidoreductase subunit NuoH [Propionibacteriaceae bacterium]|jgi:NADH-quinone oxidoreductase subunit H|nr:NADH-quinone oxidoreductase subunit NuoH [Propionibacteriaceae bacterium]